MDQWYLDYAGRLSSDGEHELVAFKFIDGSDGRINRGEILAHVVSHAMLHHGHVSEMIHTIPATAPTIDLTVFLTQGADPVTTALAGRS